jgi:hypothetical protein
MFFGGQAVGEDARNDGEEVMSLALLVAAVIDHGHLQADYSGATPGASGLMRLGRDLMRRAGSARCEFEGGSGKDIQQRAHHLIRGANDLRAGLGQEQGLA